MPTAELLIRKTEKLPPALFEEAVNYIEYLSQKAKTAHFATKLPEAVNPKLPRSAVRGCLKDKVWMADDFNAPLEEKYTHMVTDTDACFFSRKDAKTPRKYA